MKKIIIVLVVLVLGVVGLQAEQKGHRHGAESRGGDEEPLHSSQSGKEVVLPLSSVDAIGMKFEKIGLRECPRVLKAVGKVRAPQPRTAIVSHFLPGRVAELHVTIGERVKKGQPLVTLECAEVSDALTEYVKAVTAQELAKVNLAREKRIMDGGIGAKKDYLATEAEFKMADVNLESAEKRLHVLGFKEDQVRKITRSHEINPRIVVNSPIAGKVVVSQAVLGSMVDQSKEILTIIDSSVLWVDAEIYEKDVSKVRIGLSVEITVPAFPAEVFKGTISYVGDVVNEETRTITVRTEVNNPDDRLKPGMFADVSILYGETHQVLAIPLSAVLEDGDRQVVFVRENDRFVCKGIETGAHNGAYQHVIKGLNAGDEVVTEGNHQLRSKLSESLLHGAHVH
ncbi:MAG: hypothetical protein A2283_19335 [Lentisphaerae bacterium RIFOXYA12_FULL_48_11]|nr:MAG: hypothetical protein A2283_19335 [Lentisphaerae bacterium RIFOXYA12_FULL_48_11]